jgi:hypothetical protein
MSVFVAAAWVRAAQCGDSLADLPAAVKGKTELGLQHDVKSFVMRGMQISSLHILIF